MIESQTKHQQAAYLSDVSEEIKSLSNLPIILDRMNEQQFFGEIVVLFDRLFGQEINFTIQS